MVDEKNDDRDNDPIVNLLQQAEQEINKRHERLRNKKSEKPSVQKELASLEDFAEKIGNHQLAYQEVLYNHGNKKEAAQNILREVTFYCNTAQVDISTRGHYSFFEKMKRLFSKLPEQKLFAKVENYAKKAEDKTNRRSYLIGGTNRGATKIDSASSVQPKSDPTLADPPKAKKHRR